MRYRSFAMLAFLIMGACGGDATAPADPVTVSVMSSIHDLNLAVGQEWSIDVTTTVSGRGAALRSDTTIMIVDDPNAVEVTKMAWTRYDDYDYTAGQPTAGFQERYRIMARKPVKTKITFRSPYDKKAYDIVNLSVFSKG